VEIYQLSESVNTVVFQQSSFSLTLSTMHFGIGLRQFVLTVNDMPMDFSQSVCCNAQNWKEIEKITSANQTATQLLCQIKTTNKF